MPCWLKAKFINLPVVFIYLGIFGAGAFYHLPYERKGQDSTDQGRQRQMGRVCYCSFRIGYHLRIEISDHNEQTIIKEVGNDRRPQTSAVPIDDAKHDTEQKAGN